MREILFRGKTVNNERWVYGSYLSKFDNDDFADTMIEKGTMFSFAIDGKSLCQFTGMYDKNNIRIFEGDILKTTNSNCEIWFVDYKKTAFCANQSNSNYSCVLDDFMDYSHVEVIGNIHDNPELLKLSHN